MHIDEIDRTFEARPVLRIQNDAAGVAQLHRNAFVEPGRTHRNPHALVIMSGLEAAMGQLARDRLGIVVAEFLSREDVDLIAPNQLDQPFGTGPSPPQVA